MDFRIIGILACSTMDLSWVRACLAHLQHWKGVVSGLTLAQAASVCADRMKASEVEVFGSWTARGRVLTSNGRVAAAGPLLLFMFTPRTGSPVLQRQA